MQELKPAETFPCSNQRSAQWNFPLPDEFISYLELEWIDSITMGIHKIISFRILNEKKNELSELQPELFHIHRDFGIWVKKQGIEFEYVHY